PIAQNRCQRWDWPQVPRWRTRCIGFMAPPPPERHMGDGWPSTPSGGAAHPGRPGARRAPSPVAPPACAYGYRRGAEREPPAGTLPPRPATDRLRVRGRLATAPAAAAEADQSEAPDA